MHCDGTKVIDVVAIVILEFANSCKLQAVAYNNNGMSISACARFLLPHLYVLRLYARCPQLWASKNIHEYQILSSNLKRGILPAAQPGCKHRVRYVRFAYAEIEYRSRSIGWHRFSLIRKFHQVSTEWLSMHAISRESSSKPSQIWKVHDD